MNGGTAKIKSYGRFSDDGLEHVVTNPLTPNRDWFNFFWNPACLACAGQSMNGFSLYQSEKGVVTNLFGKQDVREVRFVRPFRGTDFEIHVRRGKRASIRVDGKPLADDFIPVPRKGLGKTTVRIECEVTS